MATPVMNASRRTTLNFVVAFICCAVIQVIPVRAAQAQTAAATAGTGSLGMHPQKGDWDAIVKRGSLRVLVVPSRTQYFVDKGTERGITHDLFKGFEDETNKSLKTKAIKFHVVFIPVSPEELILALVAGRGDVGAANLTITEAGQKEVDFSTPLLTGIKELVVTGPNSPALKSVDDLAGIELHVRKSSSYWEHVEALNTRLVAAGRKPVKLVAASENLADEDLLEMLNAGLLPAVVVESHLTTVWADVFPKIVVHQDISVHDGGEIAWAFRKNSPQLKVELDDFIKTHGKGTEFGNVLLKRYLQNATYLKEATNPEELKKFAQTIEIFRKYGEKYDVDYLLMMAQGYQESRLDQSVKSPVGAIGVMQVMPATGKSLNVGDVTQLEPNIDAGVKYMRFMMDTYYAKEPMDRLNKALFTFASYNAGPAKIQSLRVEAKKQGLDPNLWFRNVEFVAAEKIGQETVTYVANIYKYYIAYTLLTEAAAEKQKAQEAADKSKAR
jgi:membrane-bound lytic murein transglycosylase MltF